MSDLSIPGARHVDPEAARLLDSNPVLLELVRKAVDAAAAVFEETGIDVEYSIDPESDAAEPRVFVTVYTRRPDRLERLRRARKGWRQDHPDSLCAPVGMTAHGV